MSKPPVAIGAAVTTVDEVLELVRQRGGRATLARRVLLEALFEADGHMSAEELGGVVQARIPDIHMSTVYRNLDDLERLGVVAHTHLGHGPSNYQLAAQAHAHFLCKECGAALEAPDVLFRGLSRSVKAKLGFTIDPHHFAILGVCSACSRSPGPTRPPSG